MSLKTCSRCSQEKPVSEFSKSKSRPDGLQYTCKRCSCEAARAAQKANPIKHRITRVVAQYGVTREEAHALIQRAAIEPCEICARATGNLCIDHDHGTHVVRGLLCMPCNAAIGLLQDSPDVAMAAALYLRTHKGGV